MDIRKAVEKDAQRLYDLLAEVQQLHADGRPDVFISGTHKYGMENILKILTNPKTPVYVATENDYVLGYAFCEIKEQEKTRNLYARKSYYIDDLCVDKSCRGKGVGRALYEYVLECAKREKCDSVTLNVWHLNEGALKFYEKVGMKPLKTVMEKVLY